MLFAYRNETRSTVHVTDPMGKRRDVAPGGNFVGPSGITKKGIIPLRPVAQQDLPSAGDAPAGGAPLADSMADLNAEGMIDLISADTMDLARLQKIEAFELDGKRRTTVLKAIAKRRESLDGQV